MQQVILNSEANLDQPKRNSKKSYQATLGSKYQLVIPKEIRQMHKLKPGDKLGVKIESDSTITLTPIPTNWAKKHRGALKKYWKGINMIEEVEKIRSE